MSHSVWTIEMLGPLCVRRDEQTITRFRTYKTGALLACIACQSNRSLRRDELIDLLWPDNDLESGRNCLRIALNALRQLFEQSQEEAGVVVADRTHVRLNPAAYTTDKDQFERKLKLATRAQDDRERATLLMQATALYREDLLPGYEEAWVLGERQRLADAHLMGLRRLVKVLVKLNDHQGAVEYARRAVQADPLREESHRLLMQLYAAMGRPASALRQYQELTSLLHEELGLEPSSSTQALASQVTSAKPTSTLEREVTITASAFPAPPLPPSGGSLLKTPRPSGLPAPLTRFFGREDSLAEVLEMLNTPETRLITLTGLGGSGKTRLALAVAERVQEEFGGSVCFVPLAHLSDPAGIPDAILSSLQLPRQGSGSILDQVAGALSYGPSLLILDNFEHLAEGGAEYVSRLLSQVPTLTCLVTSRQRLNLTGEYEYGVAPLSTPHTPGTPERLMEFASVQLFVDRAKSARPSFEITPENAGSIAALCHHLEGVPLAIELAAAYAQVLSPAQILARLTPRLNLLVNRTKDAPPRHASLRAALEWSFQLLDPPVQRFFSRLSVFRGGFTLEAAEAICEDAQALEYLMQLRERSLLSAEECGSAMRFGLLETVREYAAEQLGEGEREPVSRAHRDYFLQVAEASEPHLFGPEASGLLDGLEREQANLRAALESSTAEGEKLLRLVGALWPLWYVRGYYEEGHSWLEKALQVGEKAPPDLRDRALRGAGNMAYSRRDYKQARRWFEQRLVLARERGDERAVAAALGSLGNVASDEGSYEVAQTYYTEALSLFRCLNDQRGLSLTLANLSNVTSLQGNYSQARKLHEESLSLFRAAGDQQNVLLSLNNLAYVLLRSGEAIAARTVLLESLGTARDLQSGIGLEQALTNCTSLVLRFQAPRQAAVLYGAIEVLRRRLNAPLFPFALEEYNRERADVQTTLGDHDFEIAWQQGQAMSLEQATNYALEQLEQMAISPVYVGSERRSVA